MSNILPFPRTLTYVNRMPFRHEAEIIYLDKRLCDSSPKKPSISQEEPFDPLRQPSLNIDEYDDDWGREDEKTSYAPENDDETYFSCFLVL